jgi:hypothetical protein
MTFTALLRTTPHIHQAVISQISRQISQDEDMLHYVQELCHASWMPSSIIFRIWLETWSMYMGNQWTSP